MTPGWPEGFKARAQAAADAAQKRGQYSTDLGAAALKAVRTAAAVHLANDETYTRFLATLEAMEQDGAAETVEMSIRRAMVIR